VESLMSLSCSVYFRFQFSCDGRWAITEKLLATRVGRAVVILFYGGIPRNLDPTVTVNHPTQ